MALQNFVDSVGPIIKSVWLNQIDAFVNTLFGGATTPTAARTALGLGTMSTQSAGAVAITGGTETGVSISGLTAPIAVADGGTGDTGTQWSTQTVTPVAATGTLTTASATWRFKVIGKTAFFELSLTITTNGTGATSLAAPLPTGWTTKSATVVAGRELSVTGKATTGVTTAGGTSLGGISYFDATYSGGNGTNNLLSGVLELQ